jgi:hypothetical protein
MYVIVATLGNFQAWLMGWEWAFFLNAYASNQHFIHNIVLTTLSIGGT